MERQIGKLYITSHNEMRDNTNHEFHCVVMCTGVGENERVFEGVVVYNNDERSDHRMGNYSKTWSNKFDKEWSKPVIIDNATWKPHIEIGDHAG